MMRLPPHEPDHGRPGNPSHWCERCRLEAETLQARTVEHVHDGLVYTLSNEGLKEGDLVYPVSRGTCVDGYYYHEEFDFRELVSGFPDSPHRLVSTKHSDYKPYEARTDHGFGPIQKYFKVTATATAPATVVPVEEAEAKLASTFIDQMEEMARCEEHHLSCLNTRASDPGFDAMIRTSERMLESFKAQLKVARERERLGLRIRNRS